VSLPEAASRLPVFCLAIITFMACFRTVLPGAPRVMDLKLVAFVLCRYVLLPLCLYGVFLGLLPDYAVPAALLCLLPAGMAAPALTGMYGGNVPLGFAVTVLSSTLAILTIPLFHALASHGPVQWGAGLSLFGTMALCLALPAALYSAVRRNAGVRAWAQDNGRLWAVLLMAPIVFVIVSKQRPELAAHPASAAVPFAIAAVCHGLFFFLSLPFAREHAARRTYAVCSAFNNPALGVSLALLYFGRTAVMTALMGEMIWCLLPLAAAPFLRRFASH
jgi:predicted Na+-dependent transporter